MINIFQKKHFTPEEVRPFPKAGPRQTKRKGHKRAQTLILTDSPVWRRLDAEAKEKLVKKTKPAKSTKMRVLPLKENSESESDLELPNSSDVSGHETKGNANEDLQTAKLKPGDHVLVKYSGKRSFSYYVGKIVRVFEAENTADVNFSCRQSGLTKNCFFVYPENDDTDGVTSQPHALGGTLRRAEQYIFDVDLSGFIC